MDDLISRQAALDAIDKNRQDLLSLGMDGAEHILVHYGRRVIEELPTADPVKHGKWTDRRSIAAPNRYECSVCKRMTTVDEFMGKPMYAYCPWCGAKLFTMRGEEDETDS